MKNIWLQITFRILAISASLMVFSFITEWVDSTGFFGDYTNEYGEVYGYRHWVWNITGFVIFLVQVFKTAYLVIDYVDNQNK